MINRQNDLYQSINQSFLVSDFKYSLMNLDINVCKFLQCPLQWYMQNLSVFHTQFHSHSLHIFYETHELIKLVYVCIIIT